VEWRALLDSNQWPSASETEPPGLTERASGSRSLSSRGLASTGDTRNVPPDPINHEKFAASLLPTPSGAELLCPQEVAEQLGVCRATIYNLCKRGKLPHLRVGSSVRLALADVIAALRTSRQ
jgi:excisionase family DNA binding protein